MPSHKMVVVDGVRYRPGDEPEVAPRAAVVPEPVKADPAGGDSGDAGTAGAPATKPKTTSAKRGTGGGNRS